MTHDQKINVAILNTSIVPNMQVYIDDLDKHGYNCSVIECGAYSEAEVERLVAHCKAHDIVNVMAMGMQEMDFQAVINERICDHAPSAESIQLIKNKYVQRTIEANPDMWYKPVYLDYDNETIAEMVEEYPCMLKATTFYLGYYVYKISDREELLRRLEELRNKPEFMEYVESIRQTHEQFSPAIKPEHYPPLILEKRLDLNTLRQFSVDCYTDDSTCLPYDMREELYFTNNIKIGLLFPPDRFDYEDHQNIISFCKKMGEKLIPLGLKWHVFNYEVFYTRDKQVILTEVNVLNNINFNHVSPLIDGLNHLKVIFDIHLKKGLPESINPFYKSVRGEYEQFCMQSSIQLLQGGKTTEHIDFDVIRAMDNQPDSRVTIFHDESEEIPNSRVGVSGHYCTEVWYLVDSKDRVFEKDKELRTRAMKTVDINHFVYPDY